MAWQGKYAPEDRRSFHSLENGHLLLGRNIWLAVGPRWSHPDADLLFKLPVLRTLHDSKTNRRLQSDRQDTVPILRLWFGHWPTYNPTLQAVQKQSPKWKSLSASASQSRYDCISRRMWALTYTGEAQEVNCDAYQFYPLPKQPPTNRYATNTWGLQCLSNKTSGNVVKSRQKLGHTKTEVYWASEKNIQLKETDRWWCSSKYAKTSKIFPTLCLCHSQQKMVGWGYG